MPVYVFPAMNTHMYSHPFTAKQLRIVKEELGYEIQGPIEKLLACGDLGECSWRHEIRWRDVGGGRVRPCWNGRSLTRILRLTGVGAMLEWSDIVKLVVDKYDLRLKAPPVS